jgi:hypothetical protein
MNAMSAMRNPHPGTRPAAAWLAAAVLLFAQVAATGALLPCPQAEARSCCCAPASSCCDAPSEAGGIQDGCCAIGSPDPASVPAAPPAPQAAGTGPAPSPAQQVALMAAPPAPRHGAIAAPSVDPAESPPRYQRLHAYLI